ncbi:hypothetical protein HaLaN_26383, partial [Haematococcus lacustris]
MSNKTPLTLDTLRTVRADDGLICYEDGAACQLGAGLTSSSSLQLPQALLLKRSACELPAEAGAGSASQLGLARNSRSRTLSWATSAGLEAAPPSRTQSGTLGPTLGIGQAGQAMSLAAMPTLPEHEELQAAAPHMRAAASAPLY